MKATMTTKIVFLISRDFSRPSTSYRWTEDNEDILFALLLVILVSTVALVPSSMLPITDVTVASVRALIMGDIVVEVAV